MKPKALLLTVALAGSVAFSGLAAKLGDPAGALTIKTWVKGKPVDVKDGKNVYVVEFWATWCGPCRTSIPHLTALQKKFKDEGVVFVGISDEDAGKVKPFVENMGDKMGYVVACDENRQTYRRYMQAYGQNGIPTAFIVGKEGKILWYGHPMGELEKTIEQILANKYNVQTALQRDQRRAALAEYEKLSMSGDVKAKEAGEKILADAGSDVSALCDFAFSIAANMNNKHRDFALAETALSKAEKIAGPKDHRVIGARSIVRFESGKQDEALTLAKEAIALASSTEDKDRYQNYLRVMENLKQTRKPKPPPIVPVKP